nr:transposase [Methylocystis sp. ATCC 49242]
MPVDDIEFGLSGPVHFCAAVKAAPKAGSVVHFGADVHSKSKLAEAIRYGLSRKAEFRRFLEDGRVELDNNSVERAIRPQTITRKNALFAGSEAGGQTWATIASLLATARLNDVDPNAWLTQTLERIAAGWPNKNIDALLPWNFSRG